MLNISASAANLFTVEGDGRSAFTWSSTTEAYYTITSKEEESSWFGQYFKQV